MGRIRDHAVSRGADAVATGAGRVLTGHARARAGSSARTGLAAALGGRRPAAGGRQGGILGALSLGGHSAVREFVSSFTRGIGGRFGRAASAEAAKHIGSMLANSALAKKHPIVGKIAGRVAGIKEPKAPKAKKSKEPKGEGGGHQGNKDRDSGGKFT